MDTKEIKVCRECDFYHMPGGQRLSSLDAPGPPKIPKCKSPNNFIPASEFKLDLVGGIPTEMLEGLFEYHETCGQARFSKETDKPCCGIEGTWFKQKKKKI